MDRYSHIAFAHELLHVAEEDADMAYMSTLPMIDAKPSFLHRLQCHPLARAPYIVEAARFVFGSKAHVNEPDLNSFEVVRMTEDAEEFRSLFDETKTRRQASMQVAGTAGAVLAVISHAYFDTYNNPIQAFAPHDYACSGQYAMWEKVDYFRFRLIWYEDVAPEFRARVLDNDVWGRRFPAEELVRGMIDRLANLATPKVSSRAVAAVATHLGVSDVEASKDVQIFYHDLEEAVERSLLGTVTPKLARAGARV